MKESFKGRLNLTEAASQALLQMINKLKDEDPHAEINASKLCSWIVENYMKSHFDTERNRIAQEHFNPKRYLTEMLKGATTGDEVRELIRTATLQMGEQSISNTRASKKRRPVLPDGDLPGTPGDSLNKSELKS